MVIANTWRVFFITGLFYCCIKFVLMLQLSSVSSKKCTALFQETKCPLVPNLRRALSYALGANGNLASFFEMASPSCFTHFRQKAPASSREDFLYSHCLFYELQFPEWQQRIQFVLLWRFFEKHNDPGNDLQRCWQKMVQKKRPENKWRAEGQPWLHSKSAASLCLYATCLQKKKKMFFMITLQVNSSVCQVSVQWADWPICPFQPREGKGKEMDAAARPLCLKPPRPQSEKQRTIECQ